MILVMCVVLVYFVSIIDLLKIIVENCEMITFSISNSQLKLHNFWKTIYKVVKVQRDERVDLE